MVGQGYACTFAEAGLHFDLKFTVGHASAHCLRALDIAFTVKRFDLTSAFI
jgi:hypothetical protein